MQYEKVVTKKGILILKIPQRLVKQSVSEFKTATEAILKEYQDKELKLVLDFKDCRIIDSYGLNAISTLHPMVIKQKGEIGVHNAGRNIQSLIVMQKLLSVFNLYDEDEDEIIVIL